MHCITMGYAIPPKKHWNIKIINAWQGHEVWTLAEKTIRFLGEMAALLVLLIEDENFG